MKNILLTTYMYSDSKLLNKCAQSLSGGKAAVYVAPNLLYLWLNKCDPLCGKGVLRENHEY